MRDILVIGIVVTLIPFIITNAWVGVIGWTWIGLMNPHMLSWGIARSFPLAVVVGGVTLLAFLFTRDKKVPPMNVAMITLVITAIFYTAKMPLAWVPEQSWEIWDKLMKILLMVFVTGCLIYGEKRIKWLLWTIVFSIGYYGFKGGLFSILTGGVHHVLGPPQTFISGNTEIGLVMIMVLPLMLIAARHAERKWVKWLAYSTFWLTVPAIVFTYSRGALLGLAVTFGLVLLRMQRKVLVLLLLIPVGIAGLAFTPQQLFDRAGTIKTYEEDQSSMMRIQAWGVAKNIGLSHPLTGAGFNLEHLPSTEWLAYADFLGNWENRTKAAHSIWFQVLGEHGLLGLALFLVILVSTVLTLNKAMRDLKGIGGALWLRDYAWAVRVGLTGYMVAGTFLSLAYFNLLYTYVVLAAIIAREAAAQRAALASTSQSVSPGSASPASPYEVPEPIGSARQANVR